MSEQGRPRQGMPLPVRAVFLFGRFEGERENVLSLAKASLPGISHAPCTSFLEWQEKWWQKQAEESRPPFLLPVLSKKYKSLFLQISLGRVAGARGVRVQERAAQRSSRFPPGFRLFLLWCAVSEESLQKAVEASPGCLRPPSP